jgi:bacillithiol biosynthesis cysteine-adding enzyme BshC
VEGQALKHAPLRSFAPAFLSGEAGAEAFLPADYRRPEVRAARARAAGARAVSGPVVEALRRQNAGFAPSPARAAHLEALGQRGTSAVVTGQQVGLFLGPLYTVHKAASAIALARQLARESGAPCVPVFWLQTEDHDFAEVNHCHVLDAESAPVRLELEGEAWQPVRDHVLGPALEGPLAGLTRCLEDAPSGAEVLALVRAHYRPGATLAAAFAGLLAEVFADEGLVLIDPRDPALAPAQGALHLRALTEADAIASLLEERSGALAEAGFSTQVHVRPGAPLSFFHPEGPGGPRYRLAPHPEGWSLVGPGQVVARQAVVEALARDPGVVSSSALLRPLLQDSLLPTAAVVGGPAEVSYFAQLGPLYAHLGVALPMVAPRARFRLVDARTRRWLEGLGLEPGELEVSRDALLARLCTGPGEAPAAALEAGLKAQLEAVLGGLAPPLSLDVVDAVERTRGTIARAASRLAGRYRRSLQRGDEVTRDRVDRLQHVLFPHGEPQERVVGPWSFAARVGLATLKAALFARLRLGAVEDVAL